MDGGGDLQRCDHRMPVEAVLLHPPHACMDGGDGLRRCDHRMPVGAVLLHPPHACMDGGDGFGGAITECL